MCGEGTSERGELGCQRLTETHEAQPNGLEERRVTTREPRFCLHCHRQRCRLPVCSSFLSLKGESGAGPLPGGKGPPAWPAASCLGHLEPGSFPWSFIHSLSVRAAAAVSSPPWVPDMEPSVNPLPPRSLGSRQ